MKERYSLSILYKEKGPPWFNAGSHDFRKLVYTVYSIGLHHAFKRSAVWIDRISGTAIECSIFHDFYSVGILQGALGKL